MASKGNSGSSGGSGGSFFADFQNRQQSSSASAKSSSSGKSSRSSSSGQSKVPSLAQYQAAQYAKYMDKYMPKYSTHEQHQFAKAVGGQDKLGRAIAYLDSGVNDPQTTQQFLDEATAEARNTSPTQSNAETRGKWMQIANELKAKQDEEAGMDAGWANLEAQQKEKQTHKENYENYQKQIDDLRIEGQNKSQIWDENGNYIGEDKEVADAYAAQIKDLQDKAEKERKAAGLRDENIINGKHLTVGDNRVSDTIVGSVKGYGAEVGKWFGGHAEALDLLGKEYGEKLGANTSDYAGWATDDLSAGQIGHEYDPTVWDQEIAANQKLQQDARALKESGDADIEAAKDGLGFVGSLAVDLGSNATQMALDALLGPASMVGLGIRASGGGMLEAEAEGADLKQQILYGNTVGAVEGLTEKMFGGLAKVYGKAGADDLVESVVRKLAKTEAGQKVLLFGADMLGEGIEEIVSDIASPFAKAIYDKGTSLKELGSWDGFKDFLGNALYDGLVGALMGAVGGGMKLGNGPGSYTETAQRMQTANQAESTLLERGVGEKDAKDLAAIIAKQATGEELSAKEKQKLAGSEAATALANEMQPAQPAEAAQTAPQEPPAVSNLRMFFENGETGSADAAAMGGMKANAASWLGAKIAGSETGGSVLGDMLNPETISQLPAGAQKAAQAFANTEGAEECTQNVLDYIADQARGEEEWTDEQTNAATNYVLGTLNTFFQKGMEVDPKRQQNIAAEAVEFVKSGRTLDEAIETAKQTVQKNVTAKPVQQENTQNTTGEDSDQNGNVKPELLNALDADSKDTENKADTPQAERGSGTVSFDGAVVDGRTYQAVDRSKLNRRQKAQIAVMEKVAEVTGINVTFYQSQRNENGRYTGANGLYKDGTIYLDVNAGLYAMSDDGKRTVGELAIVRTAAHEMTHFIEQFNETEYNAIRDYMVDQLTKAKGLDGLEDLIDQKMKRDSTGKLTREGAIDEIIADGCEMMLQNSEAIEQLATENPSLAQRIGDWIHDWVAKIKAAFEGVEAVHEEAKVMMRNAEELQKMWDAALKNAAKNVGNKNTAREGGKPQYEIRYPTYSESDIKNNSITLQKMDVVKSLTGNEFSDHSKSLRENVLEYFDSLDNTVHSDEFGDVALSPSSARSEIRHGSTREKIVAYAALPEVIQNGTVIYTIDKGRGLERIVTAAPIRIGKEKYYMGVMLQRDPTSQRLYAHDVVIAKEPVSSAGRHLNTNRAGSDGDKLYITDILQNAISVKGEENSSGGSAKLSDREDSQTITTGGGSDIDVDTKSETASPAVQYSVRETNNGKKVVVVEDNILDGLPENEWKAAAREAMRKFRNGVPIAGKLFRINQHSRNEYTNSHNTRYYEKKDATKFEDKLRAANNADEIIIATSDYVNEEPSHKRNDNIIDMARGKVLMRIGNNDYLADVLIGYTTGDALVLHDVENLTPTNEIKQAGLRSSGRQDDVKPDSNRTAEPNVSQGGAKSNSEVQKTDYENSGQSELQERDILPESAYEGIETKPAEKTSPTDTAEVLAGVATGKQPGKKGTKLNWNDRSGEETKTSEYYSNTNTKNGKAKNLNETDFKYVPIDEQTSMRRAAAKVAKNYDQVLADLYGSRTWMSEQVDAAWIIADKLYNEAIATGTKEAHDAFDRFEQMIQDHATEAGAALQAFAKQSRPGSAGVLRVAHERIKAIREAKAEAEKKGKTNGLISDEALKKAEEKTREYATRMGRLEYDIDQKVKGGMSEEEARNSAKNAYLDLIDEINAYRHTGLIQDSGKMASTREAAKANKEIQKLNSKFRRMLENESMDYIMRFAACDMAGISADTQYEGKQDFRKRLNTWQKLAQLTGTGTWLRNGVGNGSFGIVDVLATDNPVTILADALLSAKTGKRSSGFETGILNKVARDAAAHSLRRSILEVAANIDLDTDSDTTKYDMGTTRTYDSDSENVLTRIGSRWEQWNGYMLQSSDAWFKGMAKGSAEAAIRKANHWDKGNLTKAERASMGKEQAEKLSKKRQAEIDETVRQIAEYRTFQNDSMLSKGADKFREGLNRLGAGMVGRKWQQGQFGLGTALMPYTKVPTNLAMKAVEFSPAGALNGLREMVQVMNDQKATMAQQQKAVTDFGRGVTGTALVALMASLMKQFKFFKDWDDEDDPDVKAQNRAEGKYGMQFNLDMIKRWAKGDKNPTWENGDRTLDISSMEPLNQLIGAASLLADDEEISAKGVLKAFTQAAHDSLNNMPALQTLANIENTIRYTDTPDDIWQTLVTTAASTAGNVAGGMIPAPIKHYAALKDENVRDTSGKNAAERAKNQVKSAIPGLRQTLPVKRDAFGNEMKAGDFATRFANQYDAFKHTQVNQSDVSRELERLKNETGVSRMPSRNGPSSVTYGSGKDKETIKLQGQERTDYKNVEGSVTDMTLEELFGLPVYKNADSETQDAMVAELESYAKDTTKGLYAEHNGIDYESSYAAANEAKDPVEFLTTKTGFNLAKGANDWDAVDALLKTVRDGKLSESEQDVYEEHMQGFKKLYAMSGSGVSSKRVTDFADELRTHYESEKRADARGSDYIRVACSGKFTDEEADVFMNYAPDISPKTIDRYKEQVQYQLTQAGKSDAYDIVWDGIEQVVNGDLDKAVYNKWVDKNVPLKYRQELKDICTNYSKDRTESGKTVSGIYKAMRETGYTAKQALEFYEMIDTNYNGYYTKKEFDNACAKAFGKNWKNTKYGKNVRRLIQEYVGK